MVPDPLTQGQFDTVDNLLSLVIAAQLLTALFLLVAQPRVLARHRQALVVSAVVCGIAAYHYFRIFDSFREAFVTDAVGGAGTCTQAPGASSNEGYRYVDWLLTVPLLLVELVVVLALAEKLQASLLWRLIPAPALRGQAGALTLFRPCSAPPQPLLRALPTRSVARGHRQPGGRLSVPTPTVRAVTDSMISARGVRKSFGKPGATFEAVRGIDVDVRRGEAFGFLGPNGAGKSSTMRMIAAVSPVSSGELRILGLDPAVDGPSIRARIGVCPQEDTLDTELTVRDNLFVYGRYFGLPRKEVRSRVDELLEFVQLTDKADAMVEDLSGGMKRRLTIARSLVNRPEVLLLDEPTTGLDPQARHVVWERLFRLKQAGVTLVLTTHYMDEAEQLCDRLVVMDGGVIVAEGSPLQLIADHSTREVAELRFGVAADGSSHEALVSRVADLADRVEVLPDRLLLYSADGEETVAKVHERGLEPLTTLVRRSTLEDVFLRLTGRTLVD